MRNYGRLRYTKGKMHDAAFFKTRKEAQEFIDKNRLKLFDPEETRQTRYSARKIRNKEIYGIFVQKYNLLPWCPRPYFNVHKYWLTYKTALEIENEG